jgi:hypothetical protein
MAGAPGGCQGTGAPSGCHGAGALPGAGCHGGYGGMPDPALKKALDDINTNLAEIKKTLEGMDKEIKKLRAKEIGGPEEKRGGRTVPHLPPVASDPASIVRRWPQPYSRDETAAIIQRWQVSPADRDEADAIVRRWSAPPHNHPAGLSTNQPR